MTYALLIRPEAEDDLRQAYGWYEQQRLGLGRDFLLCIEATLGAVQDNALQFPVVHKQVRRALVRRFPCAVFYVITDSTVHVLAVFHCRRHPRSWRQRTQE